MTSESDQGQRSAADDPAAGIFRRVEELKSAGDFAGALDLLEREARATGIDALVAELIKLRVEKFPVRAGEITPEPMFEASGLLHDAAALRARMAQDGYLLLRGVLPAAQLIELRDRITAILAELGWIAGGAERMAAKAISRPRREGQPKFFQAYDRIIRLETLYRLAHETNLVYAMRQALGASAFPHPLSIVRLIFPDAPELSTPPHQDYPNNQGTPDLTAAWIPLADCGVEDGSLAVLEGSHKFGLLPLEFHLGAGNRQAVLSDELRNCRWVGADFEAGDVLLFPAMTVHRALDNQHSDRMRLSVDFRYQLEGEALTPGCLQPHFQRLTWEEIYRGWQSAELQYYWRDRDFVEVPWDQTLHQLPEGHDYDAYIKELEYNYALTRRQEARATQGGC